MPEPQPQVLERVLRALGRARTPGFNYPGYFLEIAFDDVGPDRSRLSLEAGAHNADAEGQVHLGALAVLADVALASCLRAAAGAGARLATVTLGLKLTGAPRVGRLEAEATFDGFVSRARERQGLSRVLIQGERGLVATGHAGFMVLGRPDATAPHPLPRRGEGRDTPALDPKSLAPAEARVYARARRSLGAEGGFLEAFWGLRGRRTKTGASARVWNGPHIGNRVGHTQGGVSFGLAANVACAALAGPWRLVGAEAWYVGPGTGERLRVRSTVLHRGTMTAVVRTRIVNDAGRGVLECVTSHAREEAGDAQKTGV